MQVYVAVVVPNTGPVVEVHVEAEPVTVHVSAPVGAGTPLDPVTVAVKIRDCPTVGALGESPITIVGVSKPTETFTFAEVTET